MPLSIPKLMSIAVAVTLSAGAASADTHSMLRSLMSGSGNQVTIMRSHVAPSMVMPVHTQRHAAPIMRGDAHAMVDRMMDRMSNRMRAPMPRNSLAPYWTPPRVPHSVNPFNPFMHMMPFSLRGHLPAGQACADNWLDHPGQDACLLTPYGERGFRFGSALNSPMRMFSGPGWVLMYEDDYRGAFDVRVIAE